MQILLPALALWIASAAFANAGWTVTRSERENPPNESVEHRQTVVGNNETGDLATLHFAIFHPRATELRVVDQAASLRRDLAQAMAQEHALAGVNGGYFDPLDAPVGLLVSEGKKITPVSSARLLSGVLLATPKRVDIVRPSHFKMSGQIENAVQCGPLLLERGNPVPGLNDTRPARRTFAAVNANGTTAALGVCSAVSLAQLGRILCLTNVAGEQKFARALNLDGGSSSAFWVAAGGEAFSIPEQKTVRDFVALLPRSTR